MKAIILVFLGGGAGSVLRYIIGKLLNTTPTEFPYGTFTVNIIGSLFIGIIMGISIKNTGVSNNLALLLATGFCGGFTTFSSFAYENMALLKNGDTTTFILYALGTLFIGILVVFLGILISKLLYA